MKVIVDYTDTEKEIVELKISSAQYLSDYAIRLHFNNGVDKLVDFKSFLTNSMHPSIKKYLNENIFSKYKIINGNLNWNDYDLIFPIENLYEGKI